MIVLAYNFLITINENPNLF